MEKLAKLDGPGTFKLRDLIEDADGYNIAMRVHGGETIVSAMDYYYNSDGHLSRFKQFYESRLHGDAAIAKRLADRMLTNYVHPLIVAGRVYLIESTGGVPTTLPDHLPPGKLDEFLDGFVATILARVGEENAGLPARRR